MGRLAGQPAARTNPGTEHSRRIHGHRFNAPRVEVPQTSTERSAATTNTTPWRAAPTLGTSIENGEGVSERSEVRHRTSGLG